VRQYQRLCDIYLILIFLITTVIGIAFTRIATGWTLGDWLVNYEGGFVRRGLWGEMVLQAGHALHLSPLYLTLLLTIPVYGGIFLLVRTFLKSSSWSWWVLALVISPCTLAFSVIDVYAGYHKEILYFAGLGGLLWMLRRGERRDWVLTLYLSVISVFTILSHEPEISYAPYYVAVLVIVLGNLRRAAKIIAVPAILGMCCLYAATTHPGNATTAQHICASLGSGNARLCDGAINYLGSSKEYALQEMARFIVMYHYYRNYPVLTLVALVPIVGGFTALWRRPELRFDLKVLAAMACISMAGSVQLFFYAVDWGRWIYIHIFSLFLLLLFLDSSGTGESAPVNQIPEPRAKRLGMYVFLLLYAMCWNMPHYGSRPYGYVGLAGKLIGAANHQVAAHYRK
jgi:hypothetical protein